MGNIFGEFLKDNEKITPVTNLKLESQKIVEFLGGNNEWQKWKTRTMCAFEGSGYEEILEDEEYAEAHPRMNRIVYSQLSVATVVGTAHHLISQFEDEKDGHAGWNALVDWYDGDVVKDETADALREKLGSLQLTSNSSASSYINSFLIFYRDLNKIPGEGISKGHAVSMFLKGITDPDYDTTVQIEKNKNSNLANAVSSIRKYERELLLKRSSDRKLKNRLRRLREDDNRDDREEIDGGFKHKKLRRMPEDKTDGGKFETTLTKGGFISFGPAIWHNKLGSDEKDFVTAWNSKVRHNESTSHLTIPSTIKIISNDQKKIRRVPIVDKVLNQTPSDSSASQVLPRKKISFNLDAQDEGPEDV